MMTLTITILLLAFLLVFAKTSESKSLSSMQMVKYNYKNRKNTNLIKRSENSNGGGNEVVMCNDHNECPVGFACLLPGFEMSNSKANKKCYQCNCTDLSQCFFQDKQMKCDCCGSGFTGPFCEINIDDCIKAVCLNGATCEDFVNDYTCHCTPGFTGTHCEIDIDDCISAGCKNGATCVDLVNDYTCYCMPGFTGTNCEIDINDCINAVCLNGGTCVDLVNDHTCQCSPGFRGKVCELAPCLPRWTHYGSSCYLHVSAWFTWQSAVSYCKSLDPNAYLVEITDEAENTLVNTISSPSPVWIGLSDRIEEGKFYWENSENMLTYTPDPFYNREDPRKDCVFMLYAVWIAQICTINRQIVCEMPESKTWRHNGAKSMDDY